MSEKTEQGREPEAEQEKDARLKRPEREVKDLDAPPEDADDVRGGWWKKTETGG